MTQPVQEPSQGRTNQGLDWRTRQLFRRPATALPTGLIVQPWLVLYFDDGVTTTSGAWSNLSFQSWARMNDTAGDYLAPESMGGGTRFAANITKQGVYLVELNVIWSSAITTGQTYISLQSAAATLVAWETNSGDRFTNLFSETEFQQTLITTFFKATDSDCIIDPRVQQNTTANKDASATYLKIVRLTDAGPSTDWDEGSI